MGNRKFLRLVEGAKKGDRASFDELMRLKSRNMLFIAISIMKDKEAGEDIAQEAAVSMQRSIKNLGNPEAFDAWMYRIVHNACMSEMRKMGRKSEHIDIGEESYFEAHEKREEFLPEEYLNNTEKRNELVSAIEKLPARHRECVLLYYYEEMSYEDIAHSLDIKIQDVANSLNRAKKKLRIDLLGVEGILPGAVTKAATLPATAILPVVLRLQESATVSVPMVERLLGSVAAASIVPTAIGVGLGGGAGVGAGTGVFATLAGAVSTFFGTVAGKVATAAVAIVVVTGVYCVVVEDEIAIQPEQIHQDQLERSENGSESSASTAPNSSISSDSIEISPSPEDLSQQTGLDQGKADQLVDYADNTVPSDEWSNFVEEAQLYFHSQIIDSQYEYSLYSFHDPEASSVLVSIERTDVDGVSTIAYATNSDLDNLPTGFVIILAFDQWVLE